MIFGFHFLLNLSNQLLLARAVGIAVSRRSGGRLAITLVDHFFLPLFLFLSLFFSIFSPIKNFFHRATPQIKNLLSKSCRWCEVAGSEQLPHSLLALYSIIFLKIGGTSIFISKHFVNAHLGLDFLINQLVKPFTKYGLIRNQRF